jgi:hypothetical protein
MAPCILISQNPTLRQIADTAPKHWPRVPMENRFYLLKDAPVIALCEEKGFQPIRKEKSVAVFMDSVRQDPTVFKDLGVPVVTLDAPQPGCTFLWTPVDASLFHPRPFKERKEIIAPIRIANYPRRVQWAAALREMGVKVIERDDAKRSYQTYIDNLCSAKAVINFCDDRKTGKQQMKGRVFETLAAGAILLEQAGSPTSRVVSSECFFTWGNFGALKHQIDFVRNCPRLERYQQKGFEEMKKWNAENFWQQVRALAE